VIAIEPAVLQAEMLQCAVDLEGLAKLRDAVVAESVVVQLKPLQLRAGHEQRANVFGVRLPQPAAAEIQRSDGRLVQVECQAAKRPLRQRLCAQIDRLEAAALGRLEECQQPLRLLVSRQPPHAGVETDRGLGKVSVRHLFDAGRRLCQQPCAIASDRWCCVEPRRLCGARVVVTALRSGRSNRITGSGSDGHRGVPSRLMRKRRSRSAMGNEFDQRGSRRLHPQRR